MTARRLGAIGLTGARPVDGLRVAADDADGALVRVTHLSEADVIREQELRKLVGYAGQLSGTTEHAQPPKQLRITDLDVLS